MSPAANVSKNPQSVVHISLKQRIGDSWRHLQKQLGSCSHIRGYWAGLKKKPVGPAVWFMLCTTDLWYYFERSAFFWVGLKWESMCLSVTCNYLETSQIIWISTLTLLAGFILPFVSSHFSHFILVCGIYIFYSRGFFFLLNFLRYFMLVITYVPDLDILSHCWGICLLHWRKMPNICVMLQPYSNMNFHSFHCFYGNHVCFCICSFLV